MSEVEKDSSVYRALGILKLSGGRMQTFNFLANIQSQVPLPRDAKPIHVIQVLLILLNQKYIEHSGGDYELTKYGRRVLKSAERQ